MEEIKINGITFYSVKSDFYGNPRYVVHFLDFIKEIEEDFSIEIKYSIAINRAKKVGFKIYRGKDFGGGFVCASYSLKETANGINKLKEE